MIDRSSGLVARSREYGFFRGESALGVFLMGNDNCKPCGDMYGMHGRRCSEILVCDGTKTLLRIDADKKMRIKI